MYDTMDAANGGLGGQPDRGGPRVFVFDCADDRGMSSRRRGVVVNPVLETSEIPETMPDPDNDDEGCLSVPGESFPCGRASWARVTGLDADGVAITLEGHGLFARMLQHETGHLDGFLYVDKLIGRHARAARRSVKSHGWGCRGCRGRRARCPTRSATEPMIPSVGSRVSIRHRLPTGEFTDVIGHLLALTPNVVVRTKSGELVGSHATMWWRCGS